MLTAVLFRINPDTCLAPAKLLSDPVLRGLISRAAANRTVSWPIDWLTDLAARPFWPAGSSFSQADSLLLPRIDSRSVCWLLGTADTLRQLLPQINRLLIIPADDTGCSWPQEEMTGLRDFTALGFKEDVSLNLPAPDSAVKTAEIWTRPSAIQVLAGIMAAGSCDLHLHTHCSDGADSPEQMVDRVLASGLRAFAITDHDNLSGLDPAAGWLRLRAAETGTAAPVFIPGVELSIEAEQELHLLGYFPYGGMAGIERFLAEQREQRSQRNLKMIRQLQDLGYPISLEDFRATGEGTIGRLQAAILLRDQGYFPTTAAAFDELLGHGRPAYIERPRPSPAEAIWRIRQAGGVAVLAHPGLYGWCGGEPIVAAELLRQLARLKNAGLQGVEAFHGEAGPAVRQEISAAAQALGLLRTGGSDDHGVNKEHAHIYQNGWHELTEPEILVAAALISGPPKDGQPTWFLTRRSSFGSGCGFWEFPGGKVEAGETPAEALARELAEELAVIAEIGERILVLIHNYPEQRVILVCLQACLPDKTWRLSVHDDARFVTAREALALNLLPADAQVFQYLLDHPR